MGQNRRSHLLSISPSSTKPVSEAGMVQQLARAGATGPADFRDINPREMKDIQDSK
jgi:hypothetical protein